MVTQFITNEQQGTVSMNLSLRKEFTGFLPAGDPAPFQDHDDRIASISFRTGLKGNLTKAKWCRQLLKARRDRAKFFSASLFADPAWDMLLHLYSERLTQRRVTVSDLSQASGSPMTTALRWLDALVADGLASRRRDPLDGRRIFVGLTDEGMRAMEGYLESLPPTVNPLKN